MDVVALAQLGFANTVATLGTACTADHIQKLFRFTDAVVFSFDGDSAGRRAARKALEAALPFASDVRSVKFLFLPAEHDPDSYIRAHGQEGFASMVKQAVPLSRFMVEAASDACDMSTAEGRAHMASNARVLWSLLPDGALKRQLLAEIADQVQIDSRELLQLWQPAAPYKSGQRHNNFNPSASGKSFKAGTKNAAPADRTPQPEAPDYSYAYGPAGDDADYNNSEPDSYGSNDAHGSGSPSNTTFKPSDGQFSNRFPSKKGSASGAYSSYGDRASAARPRRIAGRILSASREDRVLRALLTESQAWDKLNHDEHALLSGLPAPHGPLFIWLESQLHEHGPQPWAALREGLREHAHENYALNQLAQIPEGIESDWSEVRSILDQLSRLARQVEMQDLALRANTDPAALARYRELAALQKSS
jgi:DNA primase